MREGTVRPCLEVLSVTGVDEVFHHPFRELRKLVGIKRPSAGLEQHEDAVDGQLGQEALEQRTSTQERSRTVVGNGEMLAEARKVGVWQSPKVIPSCVLQDAASHGGGHESHGTDWRELAASFEGIGAADCTALWW